MGKTGFDLNELEQVDTAEVPLYHPTTGDKIEGVTMVLYSPDSEHAKAADTKSRAKFTNFLSRNRGADAETKQKVAEQFDREKIVACIKEVKGLTSGGKAVSPEDACAQGWIFRQAREALDNASNFIKGSPAT